MQGRIYSPMPLVAFGLLMASVSTDVTAKVSARPLPSHYYFHRQQVPLKLDGNRISISFREPRQSAAAASLQFESAGVVAEESLGRTDVTLVRMQEAERSSEEVDQRINMTLTNSEVQFASPVYFTSNGEWVTPTSRIIVRFRDEVVDVPAALSELVPGCRLEESRFAGMEGVYLLQSSARNGFDVLAEANRLAEDSRVKWAEPDFTFSAKGALLPDDAQFSDLWGLRNTGQFEGTPGEDMRCEQAWDISTGDPSVKILLLETGVDLTHPDLNVLPGASFTGSGTDGGATHQCDNHGTMMAGCITAKINNSIGVVGVAPGCFVLPAKIGLSLGPPCNNSWTGSLTWTANALNWGLAQGARVSDNPNVYGFPSSVIEEAYATTYAGGMVHFAPAGDGATGVVQYPALHANVNAVSALAPTGTFAQFSSYGAGLDLSAPGSDVVSTDRVGAAGYDAGDYDTTFGTSIACSYAAGVAALIISQNPLATASQVEGRLYSSARDPGTPGYDVFYGYGCVNAHAAIETAIPLDADGDGVIDVSDNCPAVANSDQADLDGDAVGDACDACTDSDNDGFGNPGFAASTCTVDNCPSTVNPDQLDNNSDGIGDACCCVAERGNVNDVGIVDLSDLSALVSYLTGGGFILPCPNEANVNAGGIVDLGDLSALVSYLTGGGYVLPNCA